MKISALTSGQVWTASSRSLTNIGSSAIATVSISRTTLAASANVDLRPAATQIGQLTIVVGTGGGATGAIQINMSDGTNNLTAVATAAAPASNVAFTAYNNSGTGMQVHNNDGAVAGLYIYTGYLWQQ